MKKFASHTCVDNTRAGPSTVYEGVIWKSLVRWTLLANGSTQTKLIISYHVFLIFLLTCYRHEKEATRIKEIAVEAENISTEAFNILKDAITKNRNTTDQLMHLRTDVADLERKVDSTRALAEDAQIAANQVIIITSVFKVKSQS